MSGTDPTDEPERLDGQIGPMGPLLPELLPGRFVFVAVDPGELDRLESSEILASVVEPEGLSLVLAQETADRHELAYDFVAAWITLGVQSSLGDVGLTAGVSSELSRAGIACNVIAGLRHDHLLVPVDRAEEALGLLRKLSERLSAPPIRPDDNRLT